MTATVALVLLVVLALVGAVHTYLWRRLVRDTTTRGSWPRRVGTALVAVLGLAMALAIPGGRILPLYAERFLAWPGYLWLALVLYLLLGLLVGEVARPVVHRVLRGRAAPAPRPAPVPQPVPAGVEAEGAASGEAALRAPEAEPGPAHPARFGPAHPARFGPAHPARFDPAHPPGGDLSRRLFVARSFAVASVAAAGATVGYGVHTALGPPRLKRITIPLGKLNPRADGFRIAVVSDIHLGPILGRAHTQRIVDTINRTRPDLVAIVGDLVDGSVAELGPAAAPLARLESRHGSYFVTGNHEYYSGAAEWIDHVRELGVQPLENQRVEVAGLDLAGVNDLGGTAEGQGPDFDAALGDRDPARAAVLLAHQPVQVHEAVRHGVDLQLSGHTHGGQMWPGNLVAGLVNPTVAGLERFGDTQLYVTRGAGFWGPPVRVGAPPDITVVELASPA